MGSKMFVMLCFMMSFFSQLMALTSGNLLSFWLLTELAGLSMIPLFFNCVKNKRYFIICCYLVMMNICSTFFLMGAFNMNFSFLVNMCLLIKLGMFPFMFWVISVLKGVKWFLFFILAVVSKIFMLFVTKVTLGKSMSYFNEMSMLMTFVILIFLLIKGIIKFKNYAVMSSISTGCLMYNFMDNCLKDSKYNVIIIFTIYFCMSILSMWFLDLMLKKGYFKSSMSSLLVFLFLGVPLGLLFFYKMFWSCYLMGLFKMNMIIFWMMYSVMEQWYIFNFLLEKLIINSNL